MDNLEYIVQYFNGKKTEEERQRFEQRIMTDDAFAKDVAFYISANGILKEEAAQKSKQRFRDMYQQQKTVPIPKQPVKAMWRYLAAASVIALLAMISWLFLKNDAAPDQLANNYIEQHLKTLSVTMNAEQDSLQAAVSLYNAGRLQEAFDKIMPVIDNNPANSIAVKYAGIIAVRLSRYEDALGYFDRLSSDSSLYGNPGKFYKAIALMKRNATGDEAAAALLLKEVVEQDLDGKEEARKWLRKLD